MRRSLALAAFVFLFCGAAAFGGPPDPSRSGFALSGPSAPCQWRFRSDGGLDVLTLKVTVRNSFGGPIPGCSTYCNLANASIVAKQCGPTAPGLGGSRKGGVTGEGGVINFIYRCIGGRGTVDLRVTVRCAPPIGICSRTITFTNPDLNGSRDTDNGATSIVDLGIWASGISPYSLASDFDCNGTVGIVDLGIVAGGIGKTCGDCL